MQITATMVKELRERTGAGMMECKKFLKEAEGDAECAIELLRKSGQLKADRRSGKTAAEGVVKIVGHGQRYALVEINCETDFVARDPAFSKFADQVADLILRQQPDSLDTLANIMINGHTIEKKRLDLISKVGENIQVRRFECVHLRGDTSAVYMHGNRISVLLDMQDGNAVLARDIAMHIAASRPVCIAEADVPREMIDRERRILSEQAAESGKPADIIERIITGRVKKFISEITLLGQKFVKEPDKTIQTLLKENNAEIVMFYRYELGEGIEKKQENFADEVMAQVQGTG